MSLSPALFFLILGTVFLGSQAQLDYFRYQPNFGCEIPCWQSCLNKIKYSKFWYLANDLVSKVRQLRENNPGSKGTAFLIDSSASDAKFKYQQTVAAIAAIVMPVEYNEKEPYKSCNPFFYAQHFEFGTESNKKWQCQDHCTAAKYLRSLLHDQENPHDSDNLAGGCNLGYGNTISTSPDVPCANRYYSYRELAISFINHKDQGNGPFIDHSCSQFTFPASSRKLQVLIDPAVETQEFDAQNVVKMGNEVFQNAASSLLRCMMSTCCRYRGIFEPIPIKLEEPVLFLPKVKSEDEKSEVIELSLSEVIEKFAVGRRLKQEDTEDLDQIYEEEKEL